ncbi:hypothetical protein [Granulicella sibirica]|uniref:hypothetical protein n=1 Tax=Granulicella sibirica TaxID=2479048 RepID=UPI00100937A1|nr:hypothetical protein [Granulicella sibirica]
MDKNTKELGERLLNAIKENNRLLRITTDPTQCQDPPHDNEGDAPEEDGNDNTSVAFFPLAHTRPRPKTFKEAKYKWYQFDNYTGRTISWWKHRLEFWAIFFAIGYAMITFAQWLDAGDNFQVDERALIKLVATENTTADIDTSRPMSQSISMENVGKTVAKDIRGSIVIERRTISESPSLNYEQPGTGVTFGILYPGKPATFPAFWQKLSGGGTQVTTITQSDLDAFKEGKIYFAIFGEIIYRDVFGVEHWSRFWSFLGGANQSYPTQNCTNYSNVDDNKGGIRGLFGRSKP